jgi:hypothetical protein
MFMEKPSVNRGKITSTQRKHHSRQIPTLSPTYPRQISRSDLVLEPFSVIGMMSRFDYPTIQVTSAFDE